MNLQKKQNILRHVLFLTSHRTMKICRNRLRLQCAWVYRRRLPSMQSFMEKSAGKWYIRRRRNAISHSFSIMWEIICRCTMMKNRRFLRPSVWRSATKYFWVCCCSRLKFLRSRKISRKKCRNVWKSIRKNTFFVNNWLWSGRNLARQIRIPTQKNMKRSSKNYRLPRKWRIVFTRKSSVSKAFRRILPRAR